MIISNEGGAKLGKEGVKAAIKGVFIKEGVDSMLFSREK
jgi:hypothetical protein